jgi:hypothetical protein
LTVFLLIRVILISDQWQDWWNDTDRGKSNFGGPNPLTASFGQTSHTGWPGIELVTNRPSRSMASLNHRTTFSKHRDSVRTSQRTMSTTIIKTNRWVPYSDTSDIYCKNHMSTQRVGKGKGKGKVHPRTGHESPEGE